MFRGLTLTLLIIAGVGYSQSSFAGQVTPTQVSQVDHSGTATGSAVVVIPANTCSGSNGCRLDCFLQNNATNVMYYSFTGTATTSSKQLLPGAVMNCNNGVVVDQTALSVLGTNLDKYSATESFITGQ